MFDRTIRFRRAFRSPGAGRFDLSSRTITFFLVLTKEDALRECGLGGGLTCVTPTRALRGAVVEKGAIADVVATHELDEDDKAHSGVR